MDARARRRPNEWVVDVFTRLGYRYNRRESMAMRSPVLREQVDIA